jgi:hypothetical protein
MTLPDLAHRVLSYFLWMSALFRSVKGVVGTRRVFRWRTVANNSNHPHQYNF